MDRFIGFRIVRGAVALSIGLAALALSQSGALAQTRQTKIVVPFAPGGAPDVVARVLGEEIGRAQGATVVIENRPGAGSIIASELVARAAPDGNTLLIISTSFLTNPHLHKVNYQPLTFEPVCQLVSAPSVLAVGAKSPYKSLSDLLDAARKNPGKITIASPGPSTTYHIALETLKRAANANVTYVPYPATPPALNALLGGHVDAVFSDIASMSGQLKSGTIHPLITGRAKRIPELPNVPTLAEAGFKGFDVETWFGVMAPPKTPADTMKELVSWFSAGLNSDAVKQKLAAQGFGTAGRCGPEFGSLLRHDYDWIGQMVRDANMKVQ
jgi:tripartite-type tricarboxylate transporter receptor subunit TctC